MRKHDGFGKWQFVFGECDADGAGDLFGVFGVGADRSGVVSTHAKLFIYLFSC